jgi:hypothetical protein
VIGDQGERQDGAPSQRKESAPLTRGYPGFYTSGGGSVVVRRGIPSRVRSSARPGGRRPGQPLDAAWKMVSGTASDNDAGSVRERGRTFYFSSTSAGCVRILRAASRLPPRWSSDFLLFLPRCGAVIFLYIYTFISCTNYSAPALPAFAIFFFSAPFFSFNLGAPPRSRTTFTTHDFLRKRKLLHDQSRSVFPTAVQSGPSQRFPQG